MLQPYPEYGIIGLVIFLRPLQHKVAEGHFSRPCIRIPLTFKGSHLAGKAAAYDRKGVVGFH